METHFFLEIGSITDGGFYWEAQGGGKNPGMSQKMWVDQQEMADIWRITPLKYSYGPSHTS